MENDYQFGDGRDRHYPVSAKTGIDFSDFERMQTVRKKTIRHGWQPPFAVDDKKLRKVLFRRAWKYVHGPAGKPESLSDTDWLALDKEATAKAMNFGSTIRSDAPALHHEAARLHREAVKKSGSYLALQAKVIYAAWRMGDESPEIAQQVGLTGSAVRQILNRHLSIARALGYDCGKKQHNNRRGESKPLTPKTRMGVCGFCHETFTYCSPKATYCSPDCKAFDRLSEKNKRWLRGIVAEKQNAGHERPALNATA